MVILYIYIYKHVQICVYIYMHGIKWLYMGLLFHKLPNKYDIALVSWAIADHKCMISDLFWVNSRNSLTWNKLHAETFCHDSPQINHDSRLRDNRIRGTMRKSHNETSNSVTTIRSRHWTYGYPLFVKAMSSITSCHRQNWIFWPNPGFHQPQVLNIHLSLTPHLGGDFCLT